ncbi:MAG: hypothetical protein ACT4QE_23650, partial [Anaerolineales bacterium]
MTPPPISPQPPHSLAPTFVRPLSLINPLDYMRLLYWVFLNHDWLDDYVRWCAGDDESATGRRAARVMLQNERLRATVGQAFVASIAVVFGLLAMAELFGVSVTYSSAVLGLMFGVAIGAVAGMAIGATGGVASGVAVGVTSGVAVGAAGGVAGGVTGGVAFGIAVGVAVSVAFGMTVDMTGGAMVSVAFGVAGSVAGSVAFSVISGVVRSVGGWLGLLAGLGIALLIGPLSFFASIIVAGVMLAIVERVRKPGSVHSNLILTVLFLLAMCILLALGLGWWMADLRAGVLLATLFVVLYLRLPLYPIESVVAMLAYQRIRKQHDLDAALKTFDRLYFDREMLLPLPFETAALCHIAKLNWRQGVRAAAYLGRYTNHTLAAVQALSDFAGRDPYRVFWALPKRGSLRSYVFHHQHLVSRASIAGSILERGVVQTQTPSPRTGEAAQRRAEPEIEKTLQTLDEALDHLQAIRDGQSAISLECPLHADEIYQLFHTIRVFLGYEHEADIAKAESELLWLAELNNEPLRADSLETLRQLGKVGADMRAYQQLTATLAKRDALARAQFGLSEAEKQVPDLPGPDDFYIGLVVQNWRSLISSEQQELVALQAIHGIPNNYIVGPALRGQRGRLFKGREDIYNEVRRVWSNQQVKQSILFYGQRRMGKTSILLHMEANLGPTYLPLFLDLQTVAAVNHVGAFLYSLADSIAAQLRKAGLTMPTVGHRDYSEEPFLAFRQFIEAAEAAVPEDKWVVLMLDEFEMAEDKLKDGVFPLDLMRQLRNVMHHHPRFVVVLAGSHRLDEMRRDYWDPLMSIARVIKVDCLTREAAYELITEPWEDFPLNYESDAIDRIIAATSGQPLLLQAICSGVVERV